MPTFDTPELLDALSAPVGDLISSVGAGVAAAQRAMDTASLEALQEIYERDEARFHLLQSIGYKPTWYQIPEVDAELSIALTVTGSTEERSSSRVKLYAAPVDAGYTSRFGFELQASSKVRFKVVPVPPSTAAEALQAVPPLVGRSLRQALTLLRTLAISYERPEAADLEARVIGQRPHPGAILQPDERVTLELALAPEVLGLTVAEARSLLAGELIDLLAPSDAPDHAVITAQDPNPGYALGDPASVTVEVVRVPEVLGLSFAEARGRLAALGLDLSPDQPVEDLARVTAVSPAEGTLLDPGATVRLSSVTPELLGRSVAEGRSTLAAFGARLSAPVYAPEAALVGGQTPAAGAELLLDQLVMVEIVEIPDLRGLSLREARDRVQALGGAVTTLSRTPDDARVAGSSPAAGEALLAGQTVTLSFLLMPDLSRMTLDEARVALDSVKVDMAWPTGASGAERVGAQSIAAGTVLRQGDRVSLRIATMPALIDLSAEDAEARMKALGVSLKLPRGANPTVKVERQDPELGTPLTRSTEASVSLYTVPDVRGLGLDAAVHELERRGMPHTRDVIAPRGVVEAQSPEPGRNLPVSAGPVRLTFGG